MAPSPMKAIRMGADDIGKPVETLRLALQRERGSFSNCPRGHAHSPAHRGLGPRWARSGRVSIDFPNLKERQRKKGRYAPFEKDSIQHPCPAGVTGLTKRSNAGFRFVP